eukprot:6461487-Amphidinium_carterae.5
MILACLKLQESCHRRVSRHGQISALFLTKTTVPVQKQGKASKSGEEIKAGYGYINRQGPLNSAQTQNLNLRLVAQGRESVAQQNHSREHGEAVRRLSS